MPADSDILVSVIAPVYGVEAFAEAFARSLMEQTLRENIEFIFVDDASPDGSMAAIRNVVTQYPNRSSHVRFLTHSQNRGLPGARNTGLQAARGEYVLHVDSDDFLEADMAAKLLEQATATEADMVWCDWFLSSDAGERPMQEPDSISTGREAAMRMAGGGMKYNVWNKLTRRRIFTDNAIAFPDGQPMGEDMTMIRAAACCRSTSHVSRPLYHYRRSNSGAMTQNYSDAAIAQLRANVETTCRFLLSRDAGFAPATLALKLSTRFPLLLMNPASRGFALWRQLWPETDRAIGTGADASMSRHARMAMRMARLRLWPLLHLYRFLLKTYQNHKSNG